MPSFQTALQPGANAALKIIEDGQPFISQITSMQYVASENGVVVGTRLPGNTFEFAAGNSVTIQGEVEMKLADGAAGRKLRVLQGSEIEGDGEASYEIKVNLDAGADATAGALPLDNSAMGAGAALDKAFAMAAMVAFAFGY